MVIHAHASTNSYSKYSFNVAIMVIKATIRSFSVVVVNPGRIHCAIDGSLILLTRSFKWHV